MFCPYNQGINLALLAQPADTPFKMIASCNRETQVTFLCTGAPSGYLKSHFYILGLPRGTASNISIHWGSLGPGYLKSHFYRLGLPWGTSSHISPHWGSLVLLLLTRFALQTWIGKYYSLNFFQILMTKDTNITVHRVLTHSPRHCTQGSNSLITAIYDGVHINSP